MLETREILILILEKYLILNSTNILCIFLIYTSLISYIKKTIVSLFGYNMYFSFENRVAYHLNKCESLFTQECFCQVWLKLALRIWRRGFLNLVNVFSLFRYCLLLEKNVTLHLNKLESPLLI